MAKLFIPQVGNKILLSNNWDCKIFNEYRNSKVFSGLNITPESNTNVDITFPKGTVLRVDRLYIRAPASSFDSITFTVESSPIKTLNKARFWVKIMDANTIEFEEINLTVDSYTKLKDSFRFMALTNDFQNSERLSEAEESFVSQKLFEHFKAKNNNEIVLKFDVPAEKIFYQMEFGSDKSSWGHQAAYQERAKRLEEVQAIAQNASMVLHLLPVLNGFVYYYEANETAIALDKHFDLYNKVEENYGRKKPLGSAFSRNTYKTIFDKELPYWIEDGAEIFYQEEKKDISSVAALQKLIKSVRVK